MISIQATVKGEPDTLPYRFTVKCEKEYEETIFMNSVKIAREKQARNLRLNVDQTLRLYFACIIEGLRSEAAPMAIQSDVRSVLTADSVLIGVPESLQEIVVLANVDRHPQISITVKNPVPPASMKNHNV